MSFSHQTVVLVPVLASTHLVIIATLRMILNVIVVMVL